VSLCYPSCLGGKERFGLYNFAVGLLCVSAANNYPVGDRNVFWAMLEQGIELGGAPSGHIVFGRHAPTGDGILTALLVAPVPPSTRNCERTSPSWIRTLP